MEHTPTHIRELSTVNSFTKGRKKQLISDQTSTNPLLMNTRQSWLHLRRTGSFIGQVTGLECVLTEVKRGALTDND